MAEEQALYVFLEDGINWEGPQSPARKSGFRDLAGSYVQLETMGEIDHFLQKEAAFWQEMRARIGGTAGEKYWPDEVDFGWHGLAEVKRLSLQGGGILATHILEKIIDAYGAGVLLTRNAPVSERIQSLVAAGTYEDAAKEARNFFEQRAIEQTRLNEMMSSVSHLIGVLNFEREIASARNHLSRTIENEVRGWADHVKEDVTERVRAAHAELLDQIEHARNIFQSQERQSGQMLDSKFSEMVAAFKEEASDYARQAAEVVLADRELSEPMTYWEARENAHEKRATNALKGFYILCGVAILGISVAGYYLFSPTWETAQNHWNVVFAAFLVPSLVVAWIIRQTSKLHAQQEALRRDAAERVTMMKAFIALNASDKLTTDDKHLILKALFRPSFPHDDGEPMPSWIDAVFERVGRPGS